MKEYYLGGILFNSNNVICHGRTKGSRNGVSTTPGYKAVGKLAKTVSDSLENNYTKQLYYASSPSNLNPGPSRLGKKWSGKPQGSSKVDDGALNKMRQQKKNAPNRKKTLEKGKSYADKFLNKNKHKSSKGD